ncbi:hypothetical protein ACFQZR_19585 [Paenibacillus sp. GCM10027629]|uniref:hypothetical protein n=1 Tax=Paenibacillus sp. GCM10027629 TaxID=3273414 RepID=UPI00364227F1
MSDIQKKVDDFFDSMDREEFVNLLKEAGFEVEDGDGRIIFTDDYILEDTKQFSVRSTYKKTYSYTTNHVAEMVVLRPAS